MKKYRVLGVLFFLTIKVLGQSVGVNTTTPQNSLHVHGSLQLTNELNVGGNANSKGFSGNRGDVLVANGANNTPEWQELAIPNVPTGGYGMTGTIISLDEVGLDISNLTVKNSFVENEALSDSWYVLNDVTSRINIVEDKNRINLSFQTMSSVNTKTEGSFVVFIVGVFVDNQLKSIKTARAMYGLDPFNLVTVLSTVENLSPGTHEIKVAIVPKKVNNYTGILSIGKSHPAVNNLSSFSAMSMLKIETYEIIR